MKNSLRHHLYKTLHSYLMDTINRNDVPFVLTTSDTDYNISEVYKSYRRMQKDNYKNVMYIQERIKPHSILSGENFRRAIKDYGHDGFKTYDKRIKNDVSFLIENLVKNFSYTELGAKEVCMYVIDQDLANKFK